MKKYFNILTLICLTISVTSCKKGFLEESSQDLVRPTTTAALNQLMSGEAYALSPATPLNDYLDLLTDDIQSDYNSNTLIVAGLNKYAPVFTWQRNMIDKLIEVAPTGNNTWFNYYARIKGCNVILDYVDQVEGTQSEKENLRGQALALRSYYYFMLVNLFGKPYTGATSNPETDLGVPLILTAEVSDAPIARSTVKAVYAQIEKDLLTSVPLLDANGTNNTAYKFTGSAAKLLLSRLYLYMGNWDESLKYSEATIQKKSTLQQYNSIVSTTIPATFPISYPISSPEVIWGYGSYSELSVMPFGYAAGFAAKAAFSISDAFISTYETDDLRLTYSFRNAGYFTATSTVTYKASSGKYNAALASASNGKAFRTAEAYLNRAEANIQKAIAGDASAVSRALADINLLRSNRIKTAAYVPINITDPQALYTYYKAERRRELCLEDHRWFDLRRWGMEPLTHTIQLVTGSPQTVTLSQDDSRFTLDIPTEALKRNPNLIQNP
ncbi:RagB/SusD family nutrient uptake outer membrane protein [Pedobacter sp. HMWF019]|uniref:RagB/SusD family nutrient uptake outer membrane protein n=1 Tax=Pedobacter sp. HMWF019 TaxID=2056856 RepID=UPI001304A805|nr:RagB/SusD family nutrient uptake outer membrane protein [Pedobacter sp. HMWF019]